jgi:HAD superfamily hydrolase (TIGR01490 family)
MAADGGAPPPAPGRQGAGPRRVATQGGLSPTLAPTQHGADPTLALFDLDHTLLSGDSDELWCRFLVRYGVLPASLLARNQAMDDAYRAGKASAAEYAGFHVGLLAGRSPAQWAPWRERFFREDVRPRIPDDARALVESHRVRGDRLVLTTATHRLITELTAADLGIADLIATEPEVAGGLCTGRIDGVPNMREGKVQRLHAWLAGQGLSVAALAAASAYSDSVNDLPLLGAVGRPVAVDPDERLFAHAGLRGWPVLRLRR